MPPEEVKPPIEPTQPAEAAEPLVPMKQPSVEILRLSVNSQRSETSKSGKPPTPANFPVSPHPCLSYRPRLYPTVAYSLPPLPSVYQ